MEIINVSNARDEIFTPPLVEIRFHDIKIVSEVKHLFNNKNQNNANDFVFNNQTNIIIPVY